MSGIDPAGQRDEAQAWLMKADEDLAAVRTCLDARPAPPRRRHLSQLRARLAVATGAFDQS
jgi:hypothetical protein